jgi:hypothetical protein
MEEVDVICSPLQGFWHAGRWDHGKAFFLKRLSHHGANGLVVIHQQDAMRSARFALSHSAFILHLIYRKYDEYRKVRIQERAKLNSF